MYILYICGPLDVSACQHSSYISFVEKLSAKL